VLGKPDPRSSRQLSIDVGIEQAADSPMTRLGHAPGTRHREPGFPECRASPPGSVHVEQPEARTDDGRRAAFTRYVVPELEVLTRVATSITRRHVDAEDLVQDTLLRAFRSIDRFDGAHPRAWLLTIMRNAEVNRIRRRRPELLHDPDTTLEQLTATPSGHGQLPEDLVLGDQFDGAVTAAFAALPEKFRQVLELIDLDGLNYAEAANVLGVPVGTVMSRVHRGRKRIRDRLTASGLAPRRRKMM
jgi:RNA polymerase sigma-70 factor (ECF subfamily)